PVWQPDSRSSEGPSGQVYGRAGSRAAPARTARTPVGSCPGAHWPPRRAATPELPHTRSRSPAWTPKERVRERAEGVRAAPLEGGSNPPAAKVSDRRRVGRCSWQGRRLSSPEISVD